MPRKRTPYLSVVGEPYDVSKSYGFPELFNGKVGRRVIIDPKEGTPSLVFEAQGDKEDSLRDVPLERLNARRQIRTHQYEAGCRLQALFELAEPANARAMDMSKTTTRSIGVGMVGANDKQMQAYDELKYLAGEIEPNTFLLLRLVIRDRRFIKSIGADKTEQERRELGRQFRAGLEKLAELFGLKVEASPSRPIRDKHLRAARSVSRRVPTPIKEAA